MDATKSTVEQVAVDAVVVKTRRRKKLGNLTGLRRSIEQLGLLHPIIVRNGNELVAGQRRLEACRALGWKKIPVRRVEQMTDEELRAVELDENEHRLALTDYETTKARMAEVRQIEAEAETVPEPDTVMEKGKRGPKRQPGSKKDTARRAGRSRGQIDRDKRHVELAERFPFMQSWPQHAVLKAGEKMEALPKNEHRRIAALLDQPGIPPNQATKILANLGSIEPEKRADIYERNESADRDTRVRALTDAAKLPPDPHRCLIELQQVARSIRRCKKPHSARIHAALDKFMDDIRKEVTDGES